MTDMHTPPLARSEKWAIEEVRKAHIEARTAANAKILRMRSDLSENEQALFLAIEKHLGLDRETCINDLRMHSRQEFDRLVNEEYRRNLDALRNKPKWITESIKALEIAVIPVNATDPQNILGWGFRFKDEITRSKTPPIREIFRRTDFELPDALLLTRRQQFIQEVRSRYDRKIFEHKFDRKQAGWEQEKHGGARYFTVKFMLRTPWCRVFVEDRPL